nr:hypothetical protein CFP56_66473 [Quercus suber]
MHALSGQLRSSAVVQYSSSITTTSSTTQLQLYVCGVVEQASSVEAYQCTAEPSLLMFRQPNLVVVQGRWVITCILWTTCFESELRERNISDVQGAVLSAAIDVYMF